MIHEKIDLRYILSIYGSGCIETKRLKSLLRDLYPEKHQDINLLCDACECGIVEELVNSVVFTPEMANKYVKKIENLYGITHDNAIWTIGTWTEALNFETDFSNMFYTIEENIQSPLEKYDVNLIKCGDIIINQDDIRVRYKGLKWTPYEDGSFSISLHVENRSDGAVWIRADKIEVDGENVEIGFTGDIVLGYDKENDSDAIIGETFAPNKKIVSQLRVSFNLPFQSIEKTVDLDPIFIKEKWKRDW